MKLFAAVSLNLLRVMSAFLLMEHGAQKLFAVLGREQAVEFISRSGLAGVLEFFGGLALLVGLFTRPVAFVLSGLLASAYFIAHAPRGFWPVLNGGELPAVYCFLFFFIAGNGGGEFSIDGWRRRRKQGSARSAERG